jgi:hypothetical protein
LVVFLKQNTQIDLTPSFDNNVEMEDTKKQIGFVKSVDIFSSGSENKFAPSASDKVIAKSILKKSTKNKKLYV